ncbi:MAG: hypothetical protein FWC13_07480 [Oscillospiraceae bacterium]|nr:hypothetical protein [Oscillospiraceae bacterium]
MDRLIAVFAIIGVVVIGFIVNAKRYYELNKRIEFTGSYSDSLVKFINTLFDQRDFDNEAYASLTRDIIQIQTELGDDGVIYMHDPLRGIAINNYQLLPNFLPKLKAFLSETSGYANEFYVKNIMNEASACADMLMRHLGRLHSGRGAVRKKMLNPVKCLVAGARFILSFPLMIISEFGIMSKRMLRNVQNSFIVKIVVGIISLAGSLSAVITIVVGWDEFTSIVSGFINRVIQ